MYIYICTSIGKSKRHGIRERKVEVMDEKIERKNVR